MTGGVISFVLCYRSDDHIALEVDLSGKYFNSIKKLFPLVPQLSAKTIYSFVANPTFPCKDIHLPINNYIKHTIPRKDKYSPQKSMLKTFMHSSSKIFEKETVVNLPKIFPIENSIYEFSNTTILLI